MVAKGPYRLCSSREVYRNPWIRVREDKVLQPAGTPGVFGVIELRPGASTLPLTPDGRVYLVREYKYAFEGPSIEVISGGLEDGESPLQAARRELREETGLQAAEWLDMGVVNPFTSVVQSPNYMFLARDLEQGKHSPDEAEVLDILTVPLAEAVEMVMSGEITHAASCILILKADRLLRGQ